MSKRSNFPYETYNDVVVTDEYYNILFGDKPANVSDSQQIANQDKIIDQLKSQIQNQNDIINKLNQQVNKQTNTVQELQQQSQDLQQQINNQETIIQKLGSIITNTQGTQNVRITGNKMETFGSSSDQKPTNVKIGTTFFEYDTGIVYMWTGNKWVKI